MRPSGSPLAYSRYGRSTPVFTESPKPRGGVAVRLLILIALASFITPIGAIPVAGAAALPTHASSPVALFHPGHLMSGVHADRGDPHALALTSKAIGPALTEAQIEAVKPLIPLNYTGSGAQGIGAKTLNPASFGASFPTPGSKSIGGPLDSLGRMVQNQSKAADAAPRSEAFSVPIGTVSGYVNDTSDQLGIAGVQILVYSTSLCSTARCPPATSTSNGSFTAVCAAGGGPGSDDAVVITGTNWYMDNVSHFVCVPNTNTWIGTVFLVRDGVGIGFVKDPTNSKAINGVYVQSITRDGTILGYPAGTTAPNGSYIIALPPVPSKVVFTPQSGYLGTFNYTNATPGTGPRPQYPPWTGGINMGIMYLVRETLVKAELYNSQTLNPISGAPSALQACDALVNDCQPQGSAVNGGNVRTFATPGIDYFVAITANFMQTSTPAMSIPEEPPGTVHDIGKIWETPIGTARIQDQFSMPAGGTAPFPAPNVPSIYARVCSLDGYYTGFVTPTGNLSSQDCTLYGCWKLGTTPGTIGAPPLRASVEVTPDTTPVCNPLAGPQWPIPSGYAPTWVNYTYLNTTAGHALAAPDPILVNLTVGDYVRGDAYVAGTTTAAQCFTVIQASTDNAYWNTEPYNWNSCQNPPPSFGACGTKLPGAQTSTSFCLAVPPGNSKITVAAPGYSSNWTWVHVPTYCCKAQLSGNPGWPTWLNTSSANHYRSINVTPLYGKVWGYVIEGSSGATPVPISTVQVCQAPLLQTGGCQSGFGYNGTFYNIPTPNGPDVLTVSAAGYASNSIWFNGSSTSNISLGTIPLYPLAVLGGRVVNPQGQGLYLADVKVCNIAAPGACYNGGGTNLGTGITGTDGQYNGTVIGGWLPWTTYVVAVTAPGYTTDWTFGNASSGGFTTLPQMTLQPVGVNGSKPFGLSPHPAASPAAPSGGTWLSGRFINNFTGGGVYVPAGGGVNACPFGSPLCIPVADGSNTEGFFNQSIPAGLYYLNTSANGYAVSSVFFNATQAGYLDLGDIYLTPDPWVSGRVVINQWSSVTLSTNGTYGMGYGPAASVQGCDPSRADCLSPLPIATTGFYNVSVPYGPRATIVVNPTGASHLSSPAGGFDGNITTTNISGYWTNLTGTNAYVGLDIFGIVQGKVLDNDSINESLSASVPAYGLAYAGVQLLETGNHTGSIAYTADGGGFWTFFLPAGNGPNRTQFQISDSPAYTSFGGIIHPAVHWGEQAIGIFNSTLNRFGWVQLKFNSTDNGMPVGFVGAVATGIDPYSGMSYSFTDSSDENGFLNISAIAGKNIQVISTAPDYNGSTLVVSRVNRSATTFPNGTGVGNLGVIPLPSYGFIQTASLNFSNGSAPPLSTLPTPVVVDTANNLGVPMASVSVSSSDPSIPGGGVVPNTNWAGQFFADAPIGFQDTLSVTQLGYVTNNSIHVIHSGEFLTLSTVNMTGDTVLAGRVVSDPYNAPVSGAAIQACVTVKAAQQCSNGISNLSGAFWIASAPGAITLTVSATNFVSSTSFVQGCSDCWVWAGTVSLYQYATVTGIVRGLPSGFPIIGANVSLCADTASPAGPCGPAVQSDKYGHFAISAPPSSYILMASDPNFNSTYLPVALSPGQTTTVGTLFLSQFGTATGTIYNGATFGPLMGAAVYGCAQFGQGTCAPLQTTGANGQYSFSAAPGPYEVSVTAQNFQSADGFVRIAAGITTTVSPIILYPIGTDNQIELSGRVVEQANVSRGLADAVLTAFSANASAASTPTASDGTFQLWVAYGTYVLQAAKDGYQAANLTVVAHQTLSGILFELSPKLYEVRGVITDGLNTQPLDNATIWNTTGTGSSIAPLAPLTTTDASGLYVLHLANGTHVLEATGPASSAVTYATLVFTVAVNGASSVHNQSMTPPLVVLNGRVIDAATGLALPNAAVQIQGTLADGYHYARTFTTGADGSFATTVYAGSYTATTSYQQYLGKTQTFEASGSVSYVTLSLTPTGAHGATGAGTPAWTLWAAGGVAVLAVLGAAYWAGRPMKPRVTGPTGTRGSPPRSG